MDAGGGVIRVVLVDDEELVLAAVAALLDLEPDLEVVGQAVDGRTGVRLALEHRPDVVVVDQHMPGLDGLGVTAELARTLPTAAVVVLTGRARASLLRPVLEAGAMGFVPKGAPGAVLADVVRRVHRGDRYVDPALAAEALTAPPCPLSPRELDVLRRAGDGASTRSVARSLHLSEGTVRNYLAAIVTKLGVSGRDEARRVAEEHGWLDAR
ncbi:response regulator [Cellulosimicrobium sp. Marseille-Q8652]